MYETLWCLAQTEKGQELGLTKEEVWRMNGWVSTPQRHVLPVRSSHLHRCRVTLAASRCGDQGQPWQQGEVPRETEAGAHPSLRQVLLGVVRAAQWPTGR